MGIKVIGQDDTWHLALDVSLLLTLHLCLGAQFGVGGRCHCLACVMAAMVEYESNLSKPPDPIRFTTNLTHHYQGMLRFPASFLPLFSCPLPVAPYHCLGEVSTRFHLPPDC